jgi:8-oxo-dGTP pyrophosphatase MutT (NUDIX family)
MTRTDDKVLIPRPAATVILLRPAAEGVEALMVQREHGASFAAGAWVFPGGVVEEVDHSLSLRDGRAHTLTEGFDTEPEEDRAAYRFAAIRECFEEAGMLIGNTAGPDLLNSLAAWRAQVLEESASWRRLVEQQHFQPSLDRLHYLFRRITPPGLPRRFDTRFYVTAAPNAQEASVCQAEVVDARWVNPEEALELDRQGSFTLLSPTRAGLQKMTDPELQDRVFAP